MHDADCGVSAAELQRAAGDVQHATFCTLSASVPPETESKGPAALPLLVI